ncbi:MAG: hypothetical protein K0S63_7 [Gammaproteobacteria bacterium]|jgi:hypothetical protein|nr:hypothetical protein [Gammaproteobacteria bacterium]
MTPLDKEYVTAMQTKDGAVFYDTFLNSTIFIVIADAPVAEQTKTAESNETISPIIILDSNGDKCMMLFDTKEKLASWAKREVGFVAIPGRAIVEMMGTEYHWVLNAGTDYVKVFVPDEIQSLKDSYPPKAVKGVKVPLGTQILTGAPAKIPDGVVEALKSKLSLKYPEVEKAYLGQIYYVMNGEQPHLALVIDVNKKNNIAIEDITHDVSVSTAGFLEQDAYIEVIINDGNSSALSIIKAVQPFYDKSLWH